MGGRSEKTPQRKLKKNRIFHRDNLSNEGWYDASGSTIAADSKIFEEFIDFLIEVKLFYSDAAGKVVFFNLKEWKLHYNCPAFEKTDPSIFLSLNTLNSIFTISKKGFLKFLTEKNLWPDNHEGYTQFKLPEVVWAEAHKDRVKKRLKLGQEFSALKIVKTETTQINTNIFNPNYFKPMINTDESKRLFRSLMIDFVMSGGFIEINSLLQNMMRFPPASNATKEGQ